MQASNTAARASKEALIPKQMGTAVWQSVQRFGISRIQGQDGCPFDKQLNCQCLLPWKQPRTSCPAASCCRVQESMQCRLMRAIHDACPSRIQCTPGMACTLPHTPAAAAAPDEGPAMLPLRHCSSAAALPGASQLGQGAITHPPLWALHAGVSDKLPVQ